MSNENSNFFNKIKSLVKNNCQDASVFKGFVSLSISLSIYIYLISIATGHIDTKRRLEPSEMGLVVVLLLINSGLKELKLTKDSVDITLEDKVHSNFETNKTEAHALTYLGEVLLTKKEEREKFFDILLDNGELELLEDFYNHETLWIDKSNKQIENLLHLISLGFLKIKEEYKSMYTAKCPIEQMPNPFELKEYYRLTDEGIKCLKLGSSDTIPSSATDYSPNLEVDGKKMSLSATQN